MYDLVIPRVRVKVKVGTKGQIAIPKMLRELLGIETRKYVTIEMRDDKAVISRRNTKELVEWLEVNRKPVGRDVSRYSLKNEFDKSLS
ncbi:MAG: AbrB/MazE/SpoVT family DNA-binding domain-containing protein [Methanophagales archaeon]|nr:AbrB/MazE/SpoVT family DNA-binding domain-containing protein [Methanophagales archaeon]